MKAAIKIPFVHSLLIVGVSLILAGRVTAQALTNLHSFTGSDGANPYAGLVLTNNTLYGTTIFGGSSVQGTVFAVNTDGTGFTNIHNFAVSDGSKVGGGLILSRNTLYGTAAYGGSSGWGTVFSVNTDGTGFTNLHGFTTFPFGTNSDGANPYAGLVLTSNTLYGTAERGGGAGNGTVFALNTDGTGFRILHSFSASRTNSLGVNTNGDGANPFADLILSGNTLYGTAEYGGSSGNGTVFAVNTNGTGFTNLYSFTATSLFYPYTNSDGANPQAGLLLSDATLYGTTVSGGSSGRGTVFAVNTDGTGFTNLHVFATNSAPLYTNTDGVGPNASLALSGNTLYGTAKSGGDWNGGTLFSINTNGSGFTTLYSFSASSTNSLGVYTNSDGVNPIAGLLLSGNTLYGTATGGGGSGYGTVFSIFIQPQLTIVPAETNVMLTWPTNYSGFTLQSTTNLFSPVWTTNFPEPVVVNGQNTVTNPISGTQQFFRLSQ